MNKLRIGLIIENSARPHLGGTYSYQWNLLKGINEFQFDESIEVVNVCLFEDTSMDSILKKPTIYIHQPKSNDTTAEPANYNFKKSFSVLKRSDKFMWLYKKYLKYKEAKKVQVIKSKLENERIDLIFFITQSGFDIDYPYIINCWDIAHKSTFPFPEIALNGNYELREKQFSKILGKALFVLCESEAGIKEIKNTYHLFDKKIKLLPIFGNNALIKSAETTITLQKFSLTENKFFLYPAQFWALKNHYNLLQAFYSYSKLYNDYKLFFCGSDKGNLNYIQSVVASLGLKDKVVFGGFVADEELKTLYQTATAMVFPTFLGPTNMPLLEAAQLKCPIICSNLEGHKEQLGNHALYFEPSSPQDILTKMVDITSNTSLRTAMKEGAYQHIIQSKFQLSHSLIRLNDIFKEAKNIRKTWGTPNRDL